MDKNDYVLVIDSGNGGKYTLGVIKKVLPNENYIFLFDDLNCPYGNKKRKMLFNITMKNIGNILNKYPIKLIVLACNTLSCTIYKKLVKNFNIPIFDMQPYLEEIKPDEKTLVLCTKNTKKYSKKIKDYKFKNQNIKVVGFSNLAKKIDQNIDCLDKLIPFLNNYLKKYKNYYNVVLACTHFNYIKEQLKTVINPNIKFYEYSLVLAYKIKMHLMKNDLLKVKKGKTIFLYTSMI